MDFEVEVKLTVLHATSSPLMVVRRMSVGVWHEGSVLRQYQQDGIWGAAFESPRVDAACCLHVESCYSDGTGGRALALLGA